MAGGNVRDLVRHHARDFGFLISSEDQTGVHIEEASRQRHRIDHV
jgi:hypothetical protein